MYKTSLPPDNLPVGPSFAPVLHPSVRLSAEHVAAFREALASVTDVTAISDDELRAGAERLVRFVLLVAKADGRQDTSSGATAEDRKTGRI